MKILSVIGTRPHFIKIAPLSEQMAKKGLDHLVVHTGQHYDYEMDRIFFEQLKIPEPRYNLGVGSGTHGYQTGEMTRKVEEVIVKERPDLVLVYGDTNSTLAGSLAASKLNVRVGHVEAGLRSFDRRVPEEINRVLTDHASDILFAPTDTALRNLNREGITASSNYSVYLTGDIMYDALLRNIKVAENSKILGKLGIKTKEYLVATVHRAENSDRKNLENIVEALIESEEKLVFPAHPGTVKSLMAYGLYDRLKESDSVCPIKPVGYLDMLVLEKNAKKILTDSGGMQKEAYFFKVPCVTLRDRTEWVETVNDGWNLLVGADKNKILRAIRQFEPNGPVWPEKFGDGKASQRIVEIIVHIA